MQSHFLSSSLSTEIGQNLDSNSAATLGPPAQVNHTIDHIPKNYFSKTVPYFQWLRLKLSYNKSKNPLRGFIWVQKNIGIHLPYYEMPQPSPC